MRFAGHVDIDVEVLAPTHNITLNALDLRFARASVDGIIARVETDAGAQTARFVLARALARGKHRLSIDYMGTIATQASGLFALDYGEGPNKRRALYTQFEATDARRVIPSWDEPAYKATFALDLIVHDGDGLAVSNMPVASRTPLGEGRTRIRFASSPKMSTYLLFFGLGDFERRTISVAGTEIGMITKRGDLAKGDYALKQAGEVVGWYNDYFATAYPLPKLDHVAAPGRSQFFSAMENWGAIFYFEYALLLDPKISNSADRQRVFTTVAHETAHQWFGNLVTMGWWDDLWLNEGFASWMEGKATAHFHPEWNPEMDAVGVREGAIGLDALASTHAIVQHIQDPDEMAQAFDSITYNKGEAVIRMLESYVGADAWRAGVRRYLHAHAYGNTRTDDLWTAVEAEAGKPVTSIAHQFTLQPGVPLIRVESADCAAGQTRLALSQGEFTMDRPDKLAARWQVPVIASAGGAAATLLISDGKGEATLAGCGPVVVNQGQAGYYRTLYTPALFSRLAGSYAGLAAVDQLGVMSDAWALGLTGQQPASDALDLVAALPIGSPAELWQRAAAMLDAIAGYDPENKARRSAVARFAAARLGPKLAELGWVPRAEDSDVIANLRNSLIATLGDLGDPATVAEARRRFDMDSNDPIPGGVRKAILGVIAANADQATWDRLHAMANAENAPLVRSEYYHLLADANDPRLARAALDLALTAEPGETDSAAMISRVAVTHPMLAFDFAIANYAAVAAKVDASARSRYTVGLAARASDLSILQRLEAWASANLPASSRRAADTSIASIRFRAMVREKRLPQIDAWLARR